ncbi:MAG TPA: class IV adenylate cyclase [Bacteroidota bacterium]|nr:class IV adenylate cyclase [Bacteroidota bacterium]
MPTNLELKARIHSIDATCQRAQERGAILAEAMDQVDTYFKTFAGRLKLRVINGNHAELIGYEREEAHNERVSAYEKTPVSDPVGFCGILERAFGIRVVVSKHRVLYCYKGARIHVDRVLNLGTFIEFEVPAVGDVDPEELMHELRAMFDIEPEDIVRVSYSDMLLDGKTPDEGRDAT